MALLLARHAWAGSRDDWSGDDRERPLDARGTQQAERLVALVSDLSIDRIMTSPYRRCVETVTPLAAARSLELEVLGELGEDSHPADGIALVRDLAGSDVLVCGHGGLESAVQGAPRWKKGAVLVVDDDLVVLETRRA